MRDRIEIPNGVTLYPCRPTSSLVHRCRGGVIGRFTLCLVLKTYLVLLLSSKTYIENSNKLNLNFLSGKRKTIAIVALLVMAVTPPPPPIRPPYPAPPPSGGLDEGSTATAATQAAIGFQSGFCIAFGQQISPIRVQSHTENRLEQHTHCSGAISTAEFLR